MSHAQRIDFLREALVVLGVSPEAAVLGEGRLGQMIDFFAISFRPIDGENPLNRGNVDISNLWVHFKASVLLPWIAWPGVSEVSQLYTHTDNLQFMYAHNGAARFPEFFDKNPHALFLDDPNFRNVAQYSLNTNYLTQIFAVEQFVNDARAAVVTTPTISEMPIPFPPSRWDKGD